MANTVRKYRFIDLHRIGETESWLTDMAAQGLHLKSLGPIFACFDTGESKDMRYRIDFTYRTAKMDHAQRALYEESGWEYVCGQNDMRIFRSPDACNAPELHTDPAEQAHTLQRLKRRWITLAIVTVLLYAASFSMMGFAIFFGKTPILTLIEGSMLNLPFLALLHIYGSIFAINTAVSIKKLIHSLSEGRAIHHRANWKQLYRSRVIAMCVLAIMTPFVIGLPYVALAMNSTEELPYIDSNPMLIRLADIENDPLLEREITFQNRGVDWGNSVTREWSPYAPTMLKIREQGVIRGRMWPDGSGTYSPSIDCEIYRLRFTWLADGIIHDLCRKYADYGNEPILEETEQQGFDNLYVRDEEFWREVFASRGNIVLRLRYYGEKDIYAVIDAARGFLGKVLYN